MVPGVLSFSKGLNRENAVNYTNKKIEITGGLTGDSYKDSKIMMDVSIDIISDQNILITTYAWLRASILNTVISPLLIDTRVRNMKHPPFSKSAGLKDWLYNIFLDKEYLKYTNMFIISLFLTIFSSIALILGFYIFFRDNYILSILSLFIIIYFCMITGPTISPKYCLPYVPIIFYLQAMFIEKLVLFFQKRKNS